MNHAELNERTTALVDRLRDRLDPGDYTWAIENAGNAEWELAIATIRGLQSAGHLKLTESEIDELSAIEEQVDRRLLRDVLKTDWWTRRSCHPQADWTRVVGSMTGRLSRPLRSLVSSSAGRFVLDFWTSPRTAWPRYRRRRSGRRDPNSTP
jgi:hypothetical protein